uniref:Peptidase S1 domain-containing protein n=1 Tax=Timema shepardi TaxID=629360 RepID=A0A7R9AMZ7_TIMSH|nr:unnamed protein product [Timema shepardi]
MGKLNKPATWGAVTTLPGWEVTHWSTSCSYTALNGAKTTRSNGCSMWLASGKAISASKGASLKVRLGEHDVTTNKEALRHEEYDVASVVPYPGFNNGTLAHDIALVRLRHPAKRRANIDVVCVPKQGSLFPETTNDTSCVITGWGRKNEGSSHSVVLKEIPLPLWHNSECQAALRQQFGQDYDLPDTSLCAGAEGRDACDGDGGGPLVCEKGGQWYQVGVVSFGIGCGRRNTPGVYTRVAMYQQWIMDTVLRYRRVRPLALLIASLKSIMWDGGCIPGIEETTMKWYENITRMEKERTPKRKMELKFGRKRLESRLLGSAPPSKSNLTTSENPRLAAKCNGVRPCESAQLGSTPSSSHTRIRLTLIPPVHPLCHLNALEASLSWLQEGPSARDRPTVTFKNQNHLHNGFFTICQTFVKDTQDLGASPNYVRGARAPSSPPCGHAIAHVKQMLGKELRPSPQVVKILLFVEANKDKLKKIKDTKKVRVHNSTRLSDEFDTFTSPSLAIAQLHDNDLSLIVDRRICNCISQHNIFLGERLVSTHQGTQKRIEDYPMTFICRHLHGILRNYFLSLTQRYIVEVASVDGKPQFSAMSFHVFERVHTGSKVQLCEICLQVCQGITLAELQLKYLQRANQLASKPGTSYKEVAIGGPKRGAYQLASKRGTRYEEIADIKVPELVRKRFLGREADGEHAEMPLEARVDGETTRGRVHARHKLAVVYVLEGELSPVIPVTVVHVLSHQGVGLDRTVCIHLGHVHIIDEIHHSLCTGRPVVTAGLLFQRFLQDHLKHLGGGVEVEWHVGYSVVVRHITTYVNPNVKTISRSRMKWFGHVKRMEIRRVLRRLMEEVVGRRPRRRWMDVVKDEIQSRRGFPFNLTDLILEHGGSKSPDAGEREVYLVPLLGAVGRYVVRGEQAVQEMTEGLDVDWGDALQTVAAEHLKTRRDELVKKDQEVGLLGLLRTSSIPARDTVAGVAVRNDAISKMSRIILVRAMRSLLARVRTLLSSITVLRDSIHMGSMSPSRMIHLGPSPDKVVFWLEFEISDRLLDHLFKVIVSLPGDIERREQVSDESHEYWYVVRHDLGDVEISEGSHEDLVFWTSTQCSDVVHDMMIDVQRYGSDDGFQVRSLSTSDDQYRLDGSETPIVVILFGQQLPAQRVECNELAGQQTGVLETFRNQHDLGNEVKVRDHHGTWPARTRQYHLKINILGGVIRRGQKGKEYRTLPRDISHLNRALRFSGSSVRPAYPGFMVMNIPTLGVKAMIWPIKLNLIFLALMASNTDLTCTATTDNTSTDMRLNSSKQPQAPNLCLVKKKGECAYCEGGAGNRTYLREGDVAPVGERGDHQAQGVTQVLVGVPELCIADVAETVFVPSVPPVNTCERQPDWDCQRKADEESTFIAINLATTSLECTSIVQMFLILGNGCTCGILASKAVSTVVTVLRVRLSNGCTCGILASKTASTVETVLRVRLSNGCTCGILASKVASTVGTVLRVRLSNGCTCGILASKAVSTVVTVLRVRLYFWYTGRQDSLYCRNSAQGKTEQRLYLWYTGQQGSLYCSNSAQGKTEQRLYLWYTGQQGGLYCSNSAQGKTEQRLYLWYTGQQGGLYCSNSAQGKTEQRLYLWYTGQQGGLYCSNSAQGKTEQRLYLWYTGQQGGLYCSNSAQGKTEQRLYLWYTGQQGGLYCSNSAQGKTEQRLYLWYTGQQGGLYCSNSAQGKTEQRLYLWYTGQQGGLYCSNSAQGKTEQRLYLWYTGQQGGLYCSNSAQGKTEQRLYLWYTGQQGGLYCSNSAQGKTEQRLYLWYTGQQGGLYCSNSAQGKTEQRLYLWYTGQQGGLYCSNSAQGKTEQRLYLWYTGQQGGLYCSNSAQGKTEQRLYLWYTGQQGGLYCSNSAQGKTEQRLYLWYTGQQGGLYCSNSAQGKTEQRLYLWYTGQQGGLYCSNSAQGKTEQRLYLWYTGQQGGLYCSNSAQGKTEQRLYLWYTGQQGGLYCSNSAQVPDCELIPLFQSCESYADLSRPPDLSAAESYLRWVVEHPRLSGPLFWRHWNQRIYKSLRLIIGFSPGLSVPELYLARTLALPEELDVLSISLIHALGKLGGAPIHHAELEFTHRVVQLAQRRMAVKPDLATSTGWLPLERMSSRSGTDMKYSVRAFSQRVRSFCIFSRLSYRCGLLVAFTTLGVFTMSSNSAAGPAQEHECNNGKEHGDFLAALRMIRAWIERERAKISDKLLAGPKHEQRTDRKSKGYIYRHNTWFSSSISISSSLALSTVRFRASRSDSVVFSSITNLTCEDNGKFRGRSFRSFTTHMRMNTAEHGYLSLTPDVLGELLTLKLHVLDVNLSPRRLLPLVDAGVHDEHIVPQTLAAEEDNCRVADMRKSIFRKVSLNWDWVRSNRTSLLRMRVTSAAMIGATPCFTVTAIFLVVFHLSGSSCTKHIILVDEFGSTSEGEYGGRPTYLKLQEHVFWKLHLIWFQHLYDGFEGLKHVVRGDLPLPDVVKVTHDLEKTVVVPFLYGFQHPHVGLLAETLQLFQTERHTTL